MNRDIAHAWYTAALSRAEKMPKLASLLDGGPRRQTVDEQRAMLEVLSAQYGIPLRKAQVN